MKINDVILQAITKLVVFIIITFAVFLFLMGVDNPGGGFVGGLVLAAAFVLLVLAFDIETIEKGVPLDFKKIAALGALLVVGTGTAALFFDMDFLEMTLIEFDVPILGTIHFETVLLFEAGVALAVVGVVMTIILSIGKDVDQWKH